MSQFALPMIPYLLLGLLIKR